MINRRLLRRQLFKAVKLIDDKISNVIFVLHRPELSFLIGSLNEKGVIFDCCDDYCLTSNMNPLKVIGNKKRERLLSERCNFVIATSQKLYMRNKDYNHNTFLIENGYNYENIDSIKDAKEELIKGIRRPIIAYLGNVRDWIDFELLEFLFQTHSDLSFLFLGDVNKNSKSVFSALLKRYRNVYLTGRISYSDYPCYLKFIDVGIIPFKVNKFMESVNPNKFYEFVGANIPVVSTDIGDLRMKYSEIVKIAHSKEEFSECIKSTLQLLPSELKILRTKISEVAGQHTWQQKAVFFCELLDKFVFSR
jgi:hypothetical protein